MKYCDATDKGYGCSLPPDHSGDHVAHGVGRRICHSWGRVDPRGDFEKLTQQLEDHHNCLDEYFQAKPLDLAELLETGSLTVDWEGLKFELTLNVKVLP